jgi:uncharacterized protein YfeS
MDTVLTLLDKALIPLIVTLALPLLLLLVKRGVDLFEKKTNIEVSAGNRALIDSLVEKAVLYVDEQARKAVKNGQDPADGPSKLAQAIDFIKAGAAVAGIDITGEDLAKLIEAKLSGTRKDPEPAKEAE